MTLGKLCHSSFGGEVRLSHLPYGEWRQLDAVTLAGSYLQVRVAEWQSVSGGGGDA